MTDLGDHLRRTIAERGVSLRATARRAGCSPGYLSNVIHGRKPLTPRVAAGLDQALGTGNAFTGYTLNPVPGLSRLPPESTSGLDHAAGTASRPDDRRTAEALRALTADDLTSPGEGRPVERAAIRSEPLLYAAERTAFGVPASLPGIAAGAGAVTEDHVIQVEIAAAVFRSWDNAHGGGLRRKAVIGQLAEVTALLGGPFTSGQVARRLYAVTADLAQLAGWMSWDLQLHATAQQYFLLALALARDAGDRPQVARMMYCLARQQIDLGHPGEALELAAAGSYAIRRHSSPRASALLDIARARAHACLGEERECRAALGAAQESYARDGADPAWCGFFGEDELRGLIGVTLRDLAVASPGHAARIATEARAWIEQAAAARSGAFLRSKVLDTDGIAVTSILAREPDRAAAAAGEAITLSRQVNSPRAAGRVLATITMGSRAFPRDASWEDLCGQARSLSSAR